MNQFGYGAINLDLSMQDYLWRAVDQDGEVVDAKAAKLWRRTSGI